MAKTPPIQLAVTVEPANVVAARALRDAAESLRGQTVTHVDEQTKLSFAMWLDIRADALVPEHADQEETP